MISVIAGYNVGWESGGDLEQGDIGKGVGGYVCRWIWVKMVESVSGCVNSMDLTWQVCLIQSPTTNHVHSATYSPPSVTAYINIPPGSLFSQTLPINLWSMTPVLATHTR